LLIHIYQFSEQRAIYYVAATLLKYRSEGKGPVQVVAWWNHASHSRVNKVLYTFFWVIPRRLKCICRRFGTLCYIFIGR